MTNAPRTRRQLREALEQEKKRREVAEKGSSEGWKEASRLEYAIERANLKVSDGGPHSQIIGLGAFIDKAATDARTATLQTVVDALQLREYGYADSGLRIARKGPDDLWNDLKAALKVREDRKHAETQAAIEKKVAGLTKSDKLVVDGAISPNAIRAGDAFYEALANGANRIPASHITAKRISAEDLNRPIKPAPPIVNTRLGQVAISHDGLTQYGYFHVPRISHFSVWASDSEDGASWKVGEIEKGETLTISDQEYNKPRWYFVKAEDASGNVSEPSDRISVTTKPLVDREMLAEIIDNVQIKLDVKGLQAAVDAINNIEITTADKARENAGVTPKKKPAPKKEESK